MTPLQFSLFFAAILVAYFLVHLRLIRFEAHLKEISGLRGGGVEQGEGEREDDLYM